MQYVYNTFGVCSQKILIEVDENTKKIVEVKFMGGCDGNTKGLSSLVKGMDIDEVIKKLKGTDCRSRGTSCPDQLARALEEVKNKINNY